VAKYGFVTCPGAASSLSSSSFFLKPCKTQMLFSTAPEAASRFVSFVNASPTPFHAVHNSALRLEKAGFRTVGQSFYGIDSIA
jgi:hypothetical protein